MKIKLAKWYSVLAPRPTVLISTINKDGISNAAPFSFVMPVSVDPPLIAFASVRTRHTLKNIREVGDFVVNIPSTDLIKQTWVCAESFPENVSEIEKANLTEVASSKIKSPHIKECFAKFECELEAEYEAGDHVIVVGRVVNVEVDNKVLGGDKFNPKKANPLMHVGSENFAKIGNIIKP